MNRVCLVSLIGLPGAGKTTLCEHLLQMVSLPFNVLHLCYDNLIYFNGEISSRYKEQRKDLIKSVEFVVKNFKESQILPTDLQVMGSQYKNHQQNDIVIICDDNHYYRSMRYKLFQLARKHRLGYCQIYFECPLKLAWERNSQRSPSTKIPNEIIEQMYNRLEIPNAKDNKWEENSLNLQNLHSYENNCKKIISYIVQILDQPLHPLKENASSSIISQSKTHELDLLLRKRIKMLMKSKQEQNKRLLAENLNNKRKEILKNFEFNKDGKLHGVLDLNKYVEMLT